MRNGTKLGIEKYFKRNMFITQVFGLESEASLIVPTGLHSALLQIALGCSKLLLLIPAFFGLFWLIPACSGLFWLHLACSGWL